MNACMHTCAAVSLFPLLMKCCGRFLTLLAQLLKEVNEKGPTKTEVKLQEKLHSLESKIQEKERK